MSGVVELSRADQFLSYLWWNRHNCLLRLRTFEQFDNIGYMSN